MNEVRKHRVNCKQVIDYFYNKEKIICKVQVEVLIVQDSLSNLHSHFKIITKTINQTQSLSKR